jgi:hypothetical protein
MDWSDLTSGAAGRHFGHDVSVVDGDRITVYQVKSYREAPRTADLIEKAVRYLTPDYADPTYSPAGTQRELVRLVKSWNQLSIVSMPAGSGKSTHFALLAIAAAQAAVAAAKEARAAVMYEDRAYGREVLGAFVHRWLGLRPTAAMVEAAGNALLGEELSLLGQETNAGLVKRLRKATLRERRAWRPIGETQLRGQLIDALDRPFRRGGAYAAITVADTLAFDQPLSEEVEGWEDPRIGRVLSRLDATERRVAVAYAASGTRLTWFEAARHCGLPDGFGERVRRKLMRLGRQLSTRAASGSPRLA